MTPRISQFAPGCGHGQRPDHSSVAPPRAPESCNRATTPGTQPYGVRREATQERHAAFERTGTHNSSVAYRPYREFGIVIRHSSFARRAVAKRRRIIRHLRIAILLLFPLYALSQTPPVLPPGGLIQLQVQQPAVDTTSPVTATAEFDPPTVHVGERVFYRVTIDSTESSVQWPADITAPAALKFGVKRSGQITQFQSMNFRPMASFVYEVQASTGGHFTVSNFNVNVSGATVIIPAASLDVVPPNVPTAAPRRLLLDATETNVFLGQPFRLRVMLPAGPGNTLEALREIQFNGDGLMTDKTGTRQTGGPVDINGQLQNVLACEMLVTPIMAGPLQISAQGFTAGHEFMPPISFHGSVSFSGGPAKYVLLTSEPVSIHVRPLPVEGELPGFTGAIGRFFQDPPRLSTNRLHVGEPIQLRLVFHGEGDLTRFVPPIAPRSREWQVIADPPPATSFTLIPLTDDTQQSPAIPFSYFDPATAKYVDLSVPPIPVTVVGEGLPMELPAAADTAAEGQPQTPAKLSSLATTPGTRVNSLKPPQLRVWFAGLEFAPVAGFLVLWQWDRRRRYLEAHPDVVRRAQARRALRRERRQLEKAVAAADTNMFVHHAARALSIVVAPHYPANPRALVSSDVLAQLDSPGAEVVKKIFAAADAQFAVTPEAPNGSDLLGLFPELTMILKKLEEKL